MKNCYKSKIDEPLRLLCFFYGKIRHEKEIQIHEKAFNIISPQGTAY